jgi:hypothetical protein
MHVADEKQAVRLVLNANPILQGAQVIAQVNARRGLQPGQNDWLLPLLIHAIRMSDGGPSIVNFASLEPLQKSRPQVWNWQFMRRKMAKSRFSPEIQCIRQIMPIISLNSQGMLFCCENGFCAGGESADGSGFTG